MFSELNSGAADCSLAWKNCDGRGGAVGEHSGFVSDVFECGGSDAREGIAGAGGIGSDRCVEARFTFLAIWAGKSGAKRQLEMGERERRLESVVWTGGRCGGNE